MKAVLKDFCGSSKLWGREKGAIVREEILSEFKGSNDKTLEIDFAGIEILDYSFASEVMATIIDRLAGELEGKHVVFANMGVYVEENVDSALERAELCAVLLNNNTWKMIGKCSEALNNTFKVILDLKEADTRTIAEQLNVQIPACNNRLKTLLGLGLIERYETPAPTGGIQYIYKSII